MRLLHLVILFAFMVQLVLCATCPAQDPGLIGLTLDRQLPREHVEFAGTLPQAIELFAGLTAVRMQVDSSVYDVLPWGDRTTFRATFQHQTLRQALTAICRKLGLEYDLSNQTIVLHPPPALRRMGRRCTVEELAALDLLGRVPLQAAQLHTSAARLLAEIDARLAGSPFAIQNRALGPDDPATVTVARNSTLLEALDEMSLQTDATWYPSGKSIIVLKKLEQIRMQLGQRVTARFDGKDVSEVLLDLSQRSGIDMEIEPGAIRKIDAPVRTIRLELENASVEQALQSICGFTGLAFAVTDHGVHVWYAMPPATQPATQSGD